jgi:hypothetical protein
MKANENASKTESRRLNRIRNASFFILILFYISLAFQGYQLLACLFGWPPPFHNIIRIVVSPGHIYTTPAEMPAELLALWLLRTGVAIWCLVVLSCLFRLYERGIFFSAKNVNYIRFFGYILMVDWVINYQMQNAVHDVSLSMSPLFAGLLIIFVAWIMDEGRKIQEEQELTV